MQKLYKFFTEIIALHFINYNQSKSSKLVNFHNLKLPQNLNCTPNASVIDLKKINYDPLRCCVHTPPAVLNQLSFRREISIRMNDCILFHSQLLKKPKSINVISTRISSIKKCITLKFFFEKRFFL